MEAYTVFDGNSWISDNIMTSWAESLANLSSIALAAKSFNCGDIEIGGSRLWYNTRILDPTLLYRYMPGPSLQSLLSLY